jgi:signal transduction histidine kinase
MCLNEAAEDAMSFLRHEFELHRVTGRLELMPDLPTVSGDWTQLQQVFVNLAVNAMQAMVQHDTPGPTVTVRTSRAPDRGILVEIEDNGPGIPDDHLAHLFDSFFSTKEGGLGIGLSICRSIVEAHGGRIACVNLPVGARFSFTLPAAERDQPGPTTAGQPVTCPSPIAD